MVQKQEMKERLLAFLGEGSQANIHYVYSTTVNVQAISEKFKGLKIDERQQMVKQWFKAEEPSLEVMLASLYTSDEAVEYGVKIEGETTEVDVLPSTWLELIDWGLQGKRIQRKQHSPKTISFYSFKGGVGRTTAMVHAAWALASKGKKVVMVDMDFEAPSLHRTQKMSVPEKGLVDYLYERANLFGDEEPEVSIADIVGEVPVSRGKLFVVPAGKVDVDYIAKVDDLRNLSIYDQQLWDEFRNDIVRQLQPDIILVDSRTGINVWGALSMLMIADKSVLFMNPNRQNSEGMDTIITSLIKVGIDPYVVLSPVTGGEVGREKAMGVWRDLVESMNESRSAEPGAEELHRFMEIKEPVMVPYASEIAIADEYPVPAFLTIYEKIVEFIDDESDKQKLVDIFSGKERWEIIESLQFTSLDAEGGVDTEVELFQKTADFERYIDPSTILVRGKKGTGKTQLFWMTLRHLDELKRMSPSRLDRVIPIAGFGNGGKQLATVDFALIDEKLDKGDVNYQRLWWGIAFMQLIDQSELVADDVSSLAELKDSLPDPSSSIKERMELALQLSTDDRQYHLVKEVLKQINQKLGSTKETIWLLYDNLDDILTKQNDHKRQEILIGLFQFALSLEGAGIKSIRPKIFLRSDIWHRLEFEQKKNFVGRDMDLKWSWEDMLRLAVRQVMRSDKFRKLVEEFSPLAEIDQASEEALEKVMNLLWGIELVEGVKTSDSVRIYLHDAKGEYFPRSLITFLTSSKQGELESSIPRQGFERGGLLTSLSVGVGVVTAIRQRCVDLRLEYQNLDDIGFFDFLKTVHSETNARPFFDWWSNNAVARYESFEDLLSQIKGMGLATVTSSSKEVWLKFTYMYELGFSMRKWEGATRNTGSRRAGN